MTDEWDPDTYDDNEFVTDHGRDHIDLLELASDERVLDVGCGTGHLTAALAERCDEAVDLGPRLRWSDERGRHIHRSSSSRATSASSRRTT